MEDLSVKANPLTVELSKEEEMRTWKKNRMHIAATCTALTFIFSPEARADALSSLVDGAVDILADTATGSINEIVDGASVGDAAWNSAVDEIVSRSSKAVVSALTKYIPDLVSQVDTEEFAAKIVARQKNVWNSLSPETLKDMGTGIVVGLTIDAIAESIREEAGGEGSPTGELAYYFVLQTKVVYAFATEGIYGATLEAGAIAGSQIKRSVDLAIELDKINGKNEAMEAYNVAMANAAALRSQYLTASPSDKPAIISSIRLGMSNDLSYETRSLLGVGVKETSFVPGHNSIIDGFISALKNADLAKYEVLDRLIEEIKVANTLEQANALRTRAQEFLEANFHSVEASTFTTAIDDSHEQAFLQFIDPGVDQEFGIVPPPDDYGVELWPVIDPNPNDSTGDPGFGPDDNSDDPGYQIGGAPSAGSSIVIDDDGNTNIVDDTGSIVVEIDPGTGTSNEPTTPVDPGPTQEELAQQLAQLEAQRENLFDTRDSQNIVKLQAEALIANNDTGLAILQFQVLETVQNTLSIVDQEIQSLRNELNSTGLGAADAQRLQDLLRYGEVLEDELVDINDDIYGLQLTNAQVQQTLNEANTNITSNTVALAQNRNSILALDQNYDFASYVVPTVSNQLPNWNDYEYALPPFGQTDIPTDPTDPVDPSDPDTVAVVTFLNGVGIGDVPSEFWATFPEDNFAEATDGNVPEIPFEHAAADQNGVPTSGERTSGFNYLRWGTYTGIVEGYSNFSGQTYPIQNMFWMYGAPTPEATLEQRSGSASFAGNLYGHAFDTEGSNRGARYNAVTGEFGLNIDFATNDVDGEGYVEGLYSSPLRFNLDGDFSASNTSDVRSVSGTFDVGSFGISTANNVVASLTVDDDGTTGSGFLYGSFFGPNADEFGGNFGIFTGDDVVAGVATAQPGTFELPDTDPVDITGIIGFLASSNADPGSTFLVTKDAASAREIDGGALVLDMPDSQGGTIPISTINEQTDPRINHFFWGTFSQPGLQPVQYFDPETGITHDLERIWWLYGTPTSSSQFTSRTGTASYVGGIFGDYALRGSDQTFYDAVRGDLRFDVDFASSAVTGTFAPRITYSLDPSTFVSSSSNFSFSGSFITGSFNGATAAGFNVDLLSGPLGARVMVGDIGGGFFGPNGEEFGGVFYFFDADGGASGLVGAFEDDGSFIETYSRVIALHPGSPVEGTDAGFYHVDGSRDSVNGPLRISERWNVSSGEVTKSETFDSARYTYTSWGTWADTGAAPTQLGSSGFWVDVDVTPSSVIQTRTGSANYSGNIVGEFLPDNGTSQAAQGLININADFSNQSVSGNFQFGHDCAGNAGCGTLSRVETFNEPINDYGGSGFGNHTNNPTNSTSGVVGIFGGPNAEEIGGNAWLQDNGGTYGGVFLATQ